jgi:hypothetical protein
MSGGTPDSPVRQHRVPSVVPLLLCLNPTVVFLIGLL